MKKKTLVSILALASAPMAGYANANLDQIKTDAKTDWTGASDLDLINGVLISPAGTAIQQSIGNLLPGTYQLTTTTNTNAKILVNGVALDAENKFTLTGTSETAVTIRVESVAGGEFQVGGFKLVLVYNFAEARTALVTALSRASNRIYSNLKFDQSVAAGSSTLKVAASGITTKINPVADDLGENDFNAYQVYRDLQLYLGVENSTVMKEINEFSSRVDVQVANAEAYDAVLTLVKTLQDALNAAKNTDGITDTDTKAYAEALIKAEGENAQGKIDEYSKTAKAAYEAWENVGSNATAVCTEAANKAFNDEVTAIVNGISSALKTAVEDHAAYIVIAPLVEQQKAAYESALQAVYAALVDADGNAELFKPTRDAAYKELYAQYEIVLGVERKNGTPTNHLGAAAAQQENQKAIDGVTTQIPALQQKYIDKAQALKDAITAWTEKVAGYNKELSNIKTFVGVAEKYPTELNDIQTKINTLDGKVQEAIKANTIDVVDLTKEDGAVRTAIDDLVTKAVGSMDNYNAYTRMVDALDKAEDAYEKALAVIDGLKSKDGKYLPSAKYDDAEADFVKRIADYRKSLSAALADLSTTTKVVEWETANGADINKITTVEVPAYQKRAEDGLKLYDDAQAAWAKYNTAVEKLAATIGADTDVKIYNEVAAGQFEQTDETYGDKLDEYEGYCNAIKAKLDLAVSNNDKSNPSQYTALENARDLVKNYAPVLDVEADADNKSSYINRFAGDKARYEVDAVKDAVDNLTNEANAQITALQTALAAWNTTGINDNAAAGESEAFADSIKAYGEERTRLMAAVQVEAEKMNSIPEDEVEAMGLLYEINANLSVVTTDFAELNGRTEAAKAEYKKCAEELAKATTEVNKISVQLYGNGADVTALQAINTDPLRTEEFRKLQEETLGGRFTTLQNDIDKAFNEATIDTQYEATIKAALAQLLTDVDNGRKSAQASADNYKAYGEIIADANYVGIPGYIATAKTKVDAIVAGETTPGEEHYIDSILGTNYQKEYDALKANIDNAYKKSYSCVADKQGFINDLKALTDKINAVEATAKKNNEQYNAQIGTTNNGYADVQGRWAEVYGYIKDNDRTTAGEAFLAQLEEIQAQLTTLKTSIDNYYAIGQSDEKHAEVTGQLIDIVTTVNHISTEQSEGFVSAVDKDNQNYLALIHEAVLEGQTVYANAVETIALYSRLQNPGYVEVVTPAVDKANAAISGKLTDLRKVENEAIAEEGKLANGVLFDEDGQYLADVQAVTASIRTIMQTMNTEVNAQALPYFLGQITTQETNLADAKATIAHYRVDVQKTAFKDVEDIIKAARAIYNDVNNNPALKIDAQVTILNTVPALIQADNAAAANNEWTLEMDSVNRQVKWQLDSLNKWVYAEGVVIGGVEYTAAAAKQHFIDKYNQVVTEYFGDEQNPKSGARKYYKDNVTNGGKPLFGDVINVLKADYINPGRNEAKAVYDEAHGIWNNKELSNQRYKVLAFKLDSLQAELDKATRFVQNYVVTSPYSSIEKVQNNIDNLYDLANEWFVTGACATTANIANSDNQLATIGLLIPNVYQEANNRERAQIIADLNTLDADGVKATDAVKGTENEAAVAALVAEVSALKDKWNAENLDITTKPNDEQQKRYLGYEASIADLRADLAAYYDAALAETTYKALVEKAGKVETELSNVGAAIEGMHKPVVDEFQPSVDAMTDSIANLKASIEAHNTAGRILYYNDNLNFALDEMSEDVEEVSAAAAAEEAPYVVNDEMYAKLTEEIAALQKSYDESVEKWATYEYVDEFQGYVDGNYFDFSEEQLEQNRKDLQKFISDATAEVEKGNPSKNVKYLTANSNINSYRNNFNNRRTDLDRNYTNVELYYQGLAIRDDIQDAREEFNRKRLGYTRYTDADESTLTWKLDSLTRVYSYFDIYRSNAYLNGKTYQDINGVDYGWDSEKNQAIKKPVDYLNEGVPAMWERINELKESVPEVRESVDNLWFVLGDTDGDLSVLVPDYMNIISYAVGEVETPDVLSRDFAVADANGDGRIDIGDVTKVVDFIINGNSAVRSARMRGMAMSRVATSESVAMTMTEENGLHRIAIRLNNTGLYSGLQLDVNLPDGVTVMSETLGARAEDHELFSNTMANGTHRILISSLENSVFNNTDGAVIYLEVSGDAASKITVSNVLASDARGVVYSIGGQGGDGTTGINGVQATQNLKQRIYSVGGQVMQKLTRGLNIIQNSDGTTKKVLKK